MHASPSAVQQQSVPNNQTLSKLETPLNHAIVFVEMSSPLKKHDGREIESGTTSASPSSKPPLLSRGHGNGANSQRKSDDTDQSALRGKVKEFGRKARALLQEEKDKRREIRILDSNEASAVSRQKRSNVSLPSSNKKLAVRATKRRKLIPQRRKSVTPSTFSINLSHIPIPEKEFRSNIVKLHGLHPLFTIERIKQFFTGLRTESIFMVLSNEAYISDLDLRSDKKGTRVFIEFANSTLATLAAERSGETMKITDETEQLAAGSVSIGVTVVNKETARYMSGMAIVATPETPFHKTLSDVEDQLHPLVSTLLWKEASAKLKCALDQKKEEFDFFGNDSDNPATKLKGYQLLAQHYNQLVVLHDELLHQLPSPSVEPHETELSSIDPTVRLTSAASTVLVDEIDRIAHLLYQNRVAARQDRQKAQLAPE